MKAEEVAEIDALKRTNILLRKSLTRYEERMSHLKINSKIVLQEILTKIYSHYHKHLKKDVSVLNDFYVIDKHKTWHTLPKSINVHIENILYGFQQFVKVDFNGAECEISLHPKLLDDGFPLILLKHGKETYKISKRKEHSTHMHLSAFQPMIQGFVSDTETTKSLLMRLDSDYCIVCGDPILEQLSALWLGRDSSDPCQCSLFVDGTNMKTFLQLLDTNPNAKCSFVLSGQTCLLAYINVVDADNIPLITLSVGCVT